MWLLKRAPVGLLPLLTNNTPTHTPPWQQWQRRGHLQQTCVPACLASPCQTGLLGVRLLNPARPSLLALLSAECCTASLDQSKTNDYSRDVATAPRPQVFLLAAPSCSSTTSGLKIADKSTADVALNKTAGAVFKADAHRNPEKYRCSAPFNQFYRSSPNRFYMRLLKSPFCHSPFFTRGCQNEKWKTSV